MYYTSKFCLDLKWGECFLKIRPWSYDRGIIMEVYLVSEMKEFNSWLTRRGEYNEERGGQWSTMNCGCHRGQKIENVLSVNVRSVIFHSYPPPPHSPVLISPVCSGDNYMNVIEFGMTVILTKAQRCKETNSGPTYILASWLGEAAQYQCLMVISIG